jgi:hypothetical protein
MTASRSANAPPTPKVSRQRHVITYANAPPTSRHHRQRPRATTPHTPHSANLARAYSLPAANGRCAGAPLAR